LYAPYENSKSVVKIFNFFQKKPRLEIFVRHCHFSQVSQHKKRFSGFNREACFHNFMQTLDHKWAHVTFFLDTFFPMEEEHFIKKQTRYPVIEIKEGTETGSFLKLIDYVEQLKLAPDTLVYFLEDDYLHRSGWINVLLEGFSLAQADYLTLYDHRDKYTSPLYQELTAKIYATHSCHWRTTPSTTNTYAMRMETLKQHIAIHREFSLGSRITRDHEKFCALRAQGAQLLSPLPGWATHAEPEFASPCFPWENLLKS
jgi:hypothetical protein